MENVIHSKGWSHNGDVVISCTSSNAARRYDDGCHVSGPLLLVACTFMAQDADATTACSSAVSTHGACCTALFINKVCSFWLLACCKILLCEYDPFGVLSL